MHANVSLIYVIRIFGFFFNLTHLKLLTLKSDEKKRPNIEGSGEIMREVFQHFQKDV